MKVNGHRWGVRVGRAILELMGAKEVIRELNRQDAKRRKPESKGRRK